MAPSLKDTIPHWARGYLSDEGSSSYEVGGVKWFVNPEYDARRINPYFVSCLEEVNQQVDDTCREHASSASEAMKLSPAFKRAFGDVHGCEGADDAFGEMIREIGSRKLTLDELQNKRPLRKFLKQAERKGHEGCDRGLRFMEEEDSKYTKQQHDVLAKSCKAGVTAVMINSQACFNRKLRERKGDR